MKSLKFLVFSLIFAGSSFAQESEIVRANESRCIAKGGAIARFNNFEGCIINGKAEGPWYSATRHLTITFENGKILGPTWRYGVEGHVSSTGFLVDSKKNGEWKFFSDFGRLKSKKTYADDELDGPFIEWFPNCHRDVEGAYKHGMRHGHFKTWSSKGFLLQEGEYENDDRVGVWTFYSADKGALEQRGQFVSDEKTGTWELFTRAGTLWKKVEYEHDELKDPLAQACRAKGGMWSFDFEELEEGCFKDDDRVGLWRRWYPEGSVRFEQNYDWETHLLHGTYKEFHKSGELFAEGQFDQGMPIGDWIYKNAAQKAEGTELGRIHLERNGLEVWKKWSPDGVLLEEGNFIDGRKHGIWKKYYPSGQIEEETPYVRGQRKGPGRGWFESGELSYEGDFEGGIRVGYWKAYYRNGRVAWQGSYNADTGAKEGVWDEFSWLGNPMLRGEFRDNLRVGPWQEWHDNGELQATGNYENDERVGDWNEYWYSGAFWRTSHYVDGETNENLLKACENIEGFYSVDQQERRVGCQVCQPLDDGAIEIQNEGLWRWWHQNGRLEREGKFHRGEFEGDWRYFYEDGTIRLEGRYEKSREVGTWKGYHPNGKISFHGEYLDGVPNGLWVTFHQNGRRQSEVSYVMGQKIGTWRNYYENGNLFEEGQYDWLPMPKPVKSSFVRAFKAVQKQVAAVARELLAPPLPKGMPYRNAQSAPSGLWKTFYDSGTLKGEGIFENGQRQGNWQWYREDGSEWRAAKYKNGKEVREN